MIVSVGIVPERIPDRHTSCPSRASSEKAIRSPNQYVTHSTANVKKAANASGGDCVLPPLKPASATTSRTTAATPKIARVTWICSLKKLYRE